LFDKNPVFFFFEVADFFVVAGQEYARQSEYFVKQIISMKGETTQVTLSCPFVSRRIIFPFEPL
jgi:hypothetical protein